MAAHQRKYGNTVIWWHKIKVKYEDVCIVNLSVDTLEFTSVSVVVDFLGNFYHHIPSHENKKAFSRFYHKN